MEEAYGCSIRIMGPQLVSGFRVLVMSESHYRALFPSGTKLDFLFPFHSFSLSFYHDLLMEYCPFSSIQNITNTAVNRTEMTSFLLGFIMKA